MWYIKIAPYYIENIGKALPIVAIILGVLIHFVFILVTWEDPGVLLRNSKYEELIKREDL